MTLLGIRSDRELFRLAIELAPALLIDCANCANIHEFPETNLEKFSQLYVLPAESLYRFKPTLQKVKTFKKQLDVERLFISSFTHLFNYDDEKENNDVYKIAWEIIADLAQDMLVVVCVKPGTLQDQLATKHGITYWEDIMGHTICSQRIVSDTMLKELEQFGKALREEDRMCYMQLLKDPLKHLGSISNASSLHTWAFLLLAVLVEQQKKIDELEKKTVMM